jgi:hypothetical protein
MQISVRSFRINHRVRNIEMPKRKEISRTRKLSSQIVEGYREMVHAGCPWLYQVEGPGRLDLIGLVRGH